MKKNTTGFADVLIGLQFGDEGKAKVIDLIARDYDVIARFNGGANAGHTIETEKTRVALHQIPSGIFYPKTLLYIGSGCVVNIEKLLDEIKSVEALDISLHNRLFISDQAAIIQPHHLIIDEQTGSTIGTTKNGIGPAYADKALRMDGTRILSLRLCDLLDDPTLFLAIEKNLEETMQRFNSTNYDVVQIISKLKIALTKLTPYIQRDTLFLEKLMTKGKRVLLEGAQSVMLDVSKGSVPYVTSSNTVAAAAFVGGDVSVKFHRRTIGVAKMIMSRVGNGPFVSEFGGEESEKYCAEGLSHNKDVEKEKYDAKKLLASPDPFEVGIALRILGNEYGTVTKRPRRVGILDLVQLSYAIKTNGVDTLFLTKCDLLKDFSKTQSGKIPVVVGYKLKENAIDYVPGSNAAYTKVKTVIKNLPAFSENIEKIKTLSKLPKELRMLLDLLKKQTGCPILGIGTGPKREDYILF